MYLSKSISKRITGKVYWSKITDIYYTRIDGKLYKYPAYGDADRGWSPSRYNGDETKFKVVNKEIWSRLDEHTITNK